MCVNFMEEGTWSEYTALSIRSTLEGNPQNIEATLG